MPSVCAMSEVILFMLFDVELCTCSRSWLRRLGQTVFKVGLGAVFESPSRIFRLPRIYVLSPSADSGSLIQTLFLLVYLPRKGFPSPSDRKALPKWKHVSTYLVLGALFVFFNIELARDPYRPYMPFKFHYHVEHIVIEFTNIVVALWLIAALILWIWLFAIALLLLHYNGPLFFELI